MENSVANLIALSETRPQDNLCSTCSSYDWNYFFNRHLDLILDELNIIDSNDNVQKYTRPGSPGQFSLNVVGKSQTKIEFSLCSMTDLKRNRDCSLCSFAVAAIESAHDWDRLPPGIMRRPLKWSVTSYSETWRACELSFECMILSNNRDFVCYQVLDSSDPRLALHLSGRAITARHIEHALLKKWFTECQRYHQGVCHPKSGRSSSALCFDSNIAFRVIDVRRNCIVVAPLQSKYITLSYVWGKTKHLTIRKEDFIDPNSPPEGSDQLSPAAYFPLDIKALPKTIKDAISVVGILEESYLWVDALCIVQDNAAEKAQMIKMMDQIYSNATYCIVAAHGDAEFGLSGLHSESRRLPQIKGTVRGTKIVLRQPSLDHFLRNSLWRTRGWTFQEELFSYNRLTFIDGKAYHNCQCAEWTEGQTECAALIGTTRYTTFQNQAQSVGKLNLAKMDYKTMVRKYTARDLTHRGDILDAFAGFLDEYQRRSGFHCCWGLPTDYFTEALMWETQSFDLPAPREVQGDRSTKFPSWSWASWISTIAYDNHEDEEDPVVNEITWPWSSGYHVDPKIQSNVWETGILVFEAEIVVILMDDHDWGLERPRTDGGRNLQPTEERECIKLGTLAESYYNEQMVKVMFIRRDRDELCYRDGLTFVLEQRWVEAQPSKQWIRLG